MLGRDRRGAELKVLATALAIAVASVTTVAFFADRVERALAIEANKLLGADLVLSSDRPPSSTFSNEAARLGLSVVETLRFPSMAFKEDKSTLTEVRAVAPGYPLRGEIRIAERAFQPGRAAQKIPTPGSVWADEKLVARLGLRLGDALTLGQQSFRLDAVITQQPEAGIGFLNLAPSLTMNLSDLPQTGLVQTGSRVRYGLSVAGAEAAVGAFRQFAASRIGPGQKLETVRDTRPEIKAAHERGERFLGLASLVSVILAAAAIALAARQYVERHLDACAMMRCAGASQGMILRLYLWQLALLGAAASTAGCILGLLGQQGLALILGPMVAVELPPPAPEPALKGWVAGLALLAGFALPPLFALRKVPALRVLRRDLRAPDGLSVFGYLLGAGLIAALILWEASELSLGGYALAGTAGVILTAVGSGLLLLVASSRIAARAGSSWRLGFANLKRRRLSSLIQIAALSLGIMALLLLTLVRTDLLRNWETSVPHDAPNRFLVQIQPDQAKPLEHFFARHGMARPALFPMVRGRLVAINDKRVASADYADDRAKRLIDREFNLSFATRLQPDNAVVAGRFWSDALASRAEFSVEQGIAETLGIALGDELSYDIAGELVSARVTSLRRVEWDSFRVNFFVIAPPHLLEPYPASYVTSFYLAPERVDFLNELAHAFPNILVIDVAAILSQVQAMMARVASAVEFVFGFTLFAGLLVLYAAILATRGERVAEAGIMRALGATGRQLAAIQVAEFAALGALSGTVAALAASALAWVLASRFLHIPYSFNPWIFVAGIGCGAFGVALAGAFAARASRSAPPLETLRATGLS
jgi:putative ABC transport system permease protein